MACYILSTTSGFCNRRSQQQMKIVLAFDSASIDVSVSHISNSNEEQPPSKAFALPRDEQNNLPAETEVYVKGLLLNRNKLTDRHLKEIADLCAIGSKLIKFDVNKRVVNSKGQVNTKMLIGHVTFAHRFAALAFIEAVDNTMVHNQHGESATVHAQINSMDYRIAADKKAGNNKWSNMPAAVKCERRPTTLRADAPEFVPGAMAVEQHSMMTHIVTHVAQTKRIEEWTLVSRKKREHNKEEWPTLGQTPSPETHEPQWSVDATKRAWEKAVSAQQKQYSTAKKTTPVPSAVLCDQSDADSDTEEFVERMVKLKLQQLHAPRDIFLDVVVRAHRK